MTFYPTEFWGCEIYRGGIFKDQPIGICGWQGIIPTKAGSMAAKSTDMMTEKLFNIKEIFGRLDGREAAEHMRPGFEKAMDKIMSNVLQDVFPTDWERLNSAIKGQMMKWALAELPNFSIGFMDALVDNMDDVLDLKAMNVFEFTHDKMLLNRLFIDVGKKELIFLERSGAYFGFCFGLIQLPVFYVSQHWVILPVFGAIVGWATNFIALKMIFQPINPRKVCGITIHGLFLRRQQEASALFAELVTRQVLHSKNFWHHLLFGPRRDNFRAILVKQTNIFLDRVLGSAHSFVKAYMGEEEFIKMTRGIEQATVENIEEIVESLHDYTDRTLRLEEEIRVKMQALPYADFEGVLHPVLCVFVSALKLVPLGADAEYWLARTHTRNSRPCSNCPLNHTTTNSEEDELKLIVVGAVLGCLVGIIQTVAILGTG